MGVAGRRRLVVQSGGLTLGFALCPVAEGLCWLQCRDCCAIALQWLLRNDAIDGASAILRTAAKAFAAAQRCILIYVVYILTQ